MNAVCDGTVLFLLHRNDSTVDVQINAGMHIVNTIFNKFDIQSASTRRYVV
jgi:hypothetical protein